MSFNENAQLDTSGIDTGGGGGGGRGRGGMVAGGGIGAVILAIIMYFLTGQLPDTGTTTTQPDQGQVQDAGSGTLAQECKTGADANTKVECRIVGTLNSATAYWQEWVTKQGSKFVKPGASIYSGTTQSACGTASNQVGPFYCPLDRKIYIDASFFQILEDRFGSSGGPLAQEYVVAHEYGHHMQNLFGLLDKAQQDPQGAESGAVRVELMADCFGGVWAKHASTTKDAQGNTFLKPLSDQDIKDALSAAAAVGDDRIQKATQGRVTPENWTHGSSQARMRWFLQGYKTGDPNQCDTFAVNSVN